MYVAYPYHVDGYGRTARTDPAEYLRDLIEQVLFTTPGERVNRPTFGSGLLHMVFAPIDDELASATQGLVQAALQQWLGDLIEIEAVQVEHEEATVQVTVQYVLRRTQQRQVERFVRQV